MDSSKTRARAKRQRREDPEVVFAQGKAAAARILRVLAVDDERAQLAAAQALIDLDRTLVERIDAAMRGEAWSPA